MMCRPVRFFVALAMVVCIAGCLRMGPDFQRPDTGHGLPESYRQAPAAPVAPRLGKRWWTVFNDPDLNRLADEVLTRNLDIKKATAGVLEVRSQFVQTRADRFPKLDLEGKGQRQQRPIIGMMPGRSFVTKTSIYTLSLPASFELDLWGRLGRAEEAARASLLQAEENRLTVVQTALAEAITLYLQSRSLCRRIRIAEDGVDDYRRSLTVAEFRYAHGLAPVLDVTRARRAVAQAEASLPPLRQDLGTTLRKLAVLAGRYYSEPSDRTRALTRFERLDPVPTGLPSDLLLKRPDIRAAEAALRALNAQIGVAKAGRFPRISLTGEFGYSSDDLNRLVRPESELWSLGAGITQPVFNAGRLKAGQRAAEARYQQAVAEYAKTVLTAFSDVESALLTRREELERRRLLLDFLREAAVTQKITENRYRKGLVDYSDLLEAQQTRLKAEDTLALVELAILTNRVALCRALGFGWE